MDLKDFKKKFDIRHSETIRTYIKKGLIKIDDNGIFDEQYLKKQLNVLDLDEPFIGSDEAAKLLNINNQNLYSLSRKGYIPSYTLDSDKKGVKRFYRRSELEALKNKDYNFIQLTKYHNKNYVMNVYNDLFDIYINEVKNTVLTELEADIILSLFKDEENFIEMSKKYKLTRERVRQIFHASIDKIKLNVTTTTSKLKIYDELIKENQFLKQKLDYIENLIEEDDELDSVRKKINKIKAIPDKTLNIKLEDINFSKRTLNCFRNYKIYTIQDLLKYSRKDLLSFRNLGEKSSKEIYLLLRDKGIYIR